MHYNNIWFSGLTYTETANKIILLGVQFSMYVKNAEERRWECYSKYIEQNCFTYFLSMQCTNRCDLAMEALSDCQEAMVAR